MSKVFVMGIDGADPHMLFHLIDKGALPNLKKVKLEGVWGRLESTIPPLSSPAWPSFATGKNPGKIGVFNFETYTFESYESGIVNSFSVKSQNIWEIMGDYDKKVVVINVPVTYPPRKVNGIMVCGWPIPSTGKDFVYPIKLKGTIDEVADGYEIERADALWRRGNEEDFLEGLKRVTGKIAKVAQYILKNHPWDFFITVFNGVDAAQHFFWKYIDRNHPLFTPEEAKKYGKVIEQTYIMMDRILGKFLELLSQKDHIFIFSDHGFGPVYKRFHVNNWLEQKNLLKRRNRLISNFWSHIPIEKVNDLLIKWGIVGFSDLKLLRFFPKILLPVGKFSLEKHIDWLCTKAYSSGTYGPIFINLEGREVRGIVKKGRQYEILVNDIIDMIKKIRDPETGELLKVDVYRKDDIYTGEFLDKAPDIIYFLNNLECIPVTSFRSDGIFDYSPWIRNNADHRMKGFFIFSGMGVHTNVHLDANILDLAPTILSIMDLPIPNDFDGKVLFKAFKDHYTIKKNIRYSRSKPIKLTSDYKYSVEEEEAVKEALKGIGYLQ